MKLKFGDTVYHVANPTVRGRVVSDHIRPKDYFPTIAVIFDEPVTFSMCGGCDKDKSWVCSHNLLHPTPELAQANNNPELADPEKYRIFINRRFAG